MRFKTPILHLICLAGIRRWRRMSCITRGQCVCAGHESNLRIFAMSGGLTRFLGDSPGRVVLKLIVVSFLVGVVLASLNWTPLDVWYWARDVVVNIWDMGFEALGRFFGYFVLGAAVVVPVFLILRILRFRRS